MEVHDAMRMLALLATAVLLTSSARAAEPAPNAQPAPRSLDEAVNWLRKEAHRIIRASERKMKDGTAAFPPQVGIGYEAFWLRDYGYTLEGSIGSYSDKELIAACNLFVGGISPDGAGLDCIKFDGTLIYKPGGGRMGENPVADGPQFTVGVAFHAFQRTRDTRHLASIIEPLIKTMNAAPRNEQTGLVHIKPGGWDRCPYGFTDTIRKQGDVLFCSLLYVQASRQLSQLLTALDRKKDAEHWQAQAEAVSQSIRKVFWNEKVGLFDAATVQCRQPDIWGSAFAVYLDVASAAQAKAVAAYFKEHYAEIVQEGQIRHLPGGQYWEAGCRKDTYQNGGYWATPTGWFVYTLDLAAPKLADQTVIDMVTSFQRHGACEWILGQTHHLPNYLASAALPLDGIDAMIRRRLKNNSK